MSKCKELNERPKVLINGEDYVPRESFKEYLIEKLEDEKLDCDNQDEKDGIDYAIKCIWNS